MAIHARDPMPSAERLAAEGLALPMGPALDRESVEAVVDEVRRSLAK
jgi:dTDP-4-amino-4,6-dideoxygalactose transaminase